MTLVIKPYDISNYTQLLRKIYTVEITIYKVCLRHLNNLYRLYVLVQVNTNYYRHTRNTTRNEFIRNTAPVR